MNRPVFACFLAVLLTQAAGSATEESSREFRVWASSCCHVPADIRRGRESLAKAIRQSEGPDGFDWDIMIDAGDLSAHQTPPGDVDGQELVRQYRALTKHRREQIYNVQGNHDAPYYDHGPGSWFRKWGDPLGEFTEFSGVDPKRRPFPVEGNWERYRFVAGNVLFLMLADRNDAPAPVGRGHSSEQKRGGYPPGAVTRETFDWWKNQVLENQDKIIVTMHHHALRDTTTASGNGEGNPRYHGSSGGAAGSSYLYFIIENDDPEDFQFTPDAHAFEDFLADFHEKNGQGAIDFWIAGHTHVKGPTDDFGGKTITESRWGVNFLQAAALTRFHGGSHPLSRVLTFVEGEDQATVKTWLHESSFENAPIGFYEPATSELQLRHAFQAPPPIQQLPPFPAEARVFDQPYPGAKSAAAPAPHEAKPTPDLTENWDRETGQLNLETTEFDGRQRIRVGPIEMDDWSAITVSAWIQTTRNDPDMRVISKDEIGTPGNFVLLQESPGVWVFRVWDSSANTWARATWRGDLSNGEWRHLCGVADAKQKKALLFVDGELRGQADWNAETLDDSDETDLVVGADSGKRRFGHAFRGEIRDPRVLPRALSAEEVRQLMKAR